MRRHERIRSKHQELKQRLAAEAAELGMTSAQPLREVAERGEAAQGTTLAAAQAARDRTEQARLAADQAEAAAKFKTRTHQTTTDKLEAHARAEQKHQDKYGFREPPLSSAASGQKPSVAVSHRE